MLLGSCMPSLPSEEDPMVVCKCHLLGATLEAFPHGQPHSHTGSSKHTHTYWMVHCPHEQASAYRFRSPLCRLLLDMRSQTQEPFSAMELQQVYVIKLPSVCCFGSSQLAHPVILFASFFFCFANHVLQSRTRHRRGGNETKGRRKQNRKRRP